jgi:hypothetical protein
VLVVELAISPFKVEKSLISFSPSVNFSSAYKLVCVNISSAFMPSCAIISSDILLSAALMQDKLIKANKIIVATITLCLIKIPPLY